MATARTPPQPVVRPLSACTICRDEEWAAGSEPTVTACGHVFHRSCLVDWLDREQSCPNCRAQCTLEGCHSYTGAMPKRYNTRKATREAGLVSAQPPASNATFVEDGARATSVDFEARLRDMTLNDPATDLSQTTEANAHTNDSVSAQALLVGLRQQMADLVKEEIAKGLRDFRESQRPGPQDGRTPPPRPRRRSAHRAHPRAGPRLRNPREATNTTQTTRPTTLAPRTVERDPEQLTLHLPSPNYDFNRASSISYQMATNAHRPINDRSRTNREYHQDDFDLP